MHFSSPITFWIRTARAACGPDSIAIEPQVLDLLIYLIENRLDGPSHFDLIASIWAGRAISDTTLTNRIYAARRAVGDSGRNQSLIRTIARKGLRFVGRSASKA